MNMKYRIAALLATATLLHASAVFAQAKVDENLPEYDKTSGVSGNLSSVGSDTLANLMTLWAESFKKHIPERQYPDPGSRFLDSTACAD